MPLLAAEPRGSAPACPPLSCPPAAGSRAPPASARLLTAARTWHAWRRVRALWRERRARMPLAPAAAPAVLAPPGRPCLPPAGNLPLYLALDRSEAYSHVLHQIKWLMACVEVRGAVLCTPCLVGWVAGGGRAQRAWLAWRPARAAQATRLQQRRHRG